MPLFPLLKRRRGRMLSVCLAVGLLMLGCRGPERPADPLSKPQDSVLVAPLPTPRLLFDTIDLLRYQVDSVRVPNGALLTSFLISQGVLDSVARRVALEMPKTFSPRRIRAGNLTMFVRGQDSTTRYWIYRHNPTKFLLASLTDSISCRMVDIPLHVEVREANITVNSSLWNAMIDAQLPVELSHSLSEIYAWTVDFFALSPGDRFVAMYEQRFCFGEPAGVGDILMARYIHGKDTVNAYRFLQDSTYSYWDEQGRSLRRAFLKAPLQFSRISSHFSYARRHPILKVVRPHTGVDYAAPAGTPVRALGDGTVIAKGYQRGGGNFIKIRHNSVYTTAYMHLRGFAREMAVGRRVAQGQIIGFVGSTGLSTGPHLDFRVWRNGKPVDPLKIESPPVDPIRPENRLAFDSIMHLQRAILDTIRPM